MIERHSTIALQRKLNSRYPVWAQQNASVHMLYLIAMYTRAFCIAAACLSMHTKCLAENVGRKLPTKSTKAALASWVVSAI